MNLYVLSTVTNLHAFNPRNIIREACNASSEDELIFLPESSSNGIRLRTSDSIAVAAAREVIEAMKVFAPIVITTEQVFNRLKLIKLLFCYM